MGFKATEASKRERQVLGVVLRLGEATAAEVMANVPFESNDSSIRTFLRSLERKGLLKHRVEGARYVYSPRGSVERTRRTMLQNLVESFFGGSRAAAMAALLDLEGGGISDQESKRLKRLLAGTDQGDR